MARTRLVDYHLPKALVNRYFSRHVGGVRRPVFHDVGATAPALDEVTRCYPAIRAELERLLASRARLPAYHEVDPGQAEISSTEGGSRWTVFMLEVLGHRLHENRARCPETCRALAGVPDLMQAFFSVLEPRRSVPLHEGPYLGYLRYHLGLHVPADDPPTLVVDGRRYQWKAGEGVLFDDTWPHAVENRSDDVRVVLVVDVLRPLPRLPDLVNRVMTGLVARRTYGRAVARRAARFAHEPATAAGPDPA
jgi:aspartyl/asparaginyl beta-hydroxylase (cupin superfamily)